jgi:hypothetical protein
MRFVLQISFPVEKFNESIRDGSAGQKLGRILEAIKPEAVYFCGRGGQRTALVVVEMKDVSEMPRLAEPWFLQFNASVEFLPAMTPADLQQAGLDDLARQWQ